MKSYEFLLGPYIPDAGETSIEYTKVIKALNCITTKYGYRPQRAAREESSLQVADTPQSVFHLAGKSNNFENFYTSKGGVYYLTSDGEREQPIITSTNGWSASNFTDSTIYDNIGYVASDRNNIFEVQSDRTFRKLVDTPFAHSIGTVGEFLVAGNTRRGAEIDFLKNRIIWTGLQRPDNWVFDRDNNNLAGDQIFRQSNEVLAIDDIDSDMIVFLDNGISIGKFAGVGLVFKFFTLFSKGMISKAAYAKQGNMFYFMGQDSFYRTDGTGKPVSISNNIVDERIFNQLLNRSEVDKINCTINSNTQTVYWNIPIRGSTEPNLLLAYDYENGYWSELDFDVAGFLRLGSGGVTWRELAVKWPVWRDVGRLSDPKFAGSTQTAFAYIDSNDKKIKSLEGAGNLQAEIFAPIKQIEPGYNIEVKDVYATVESGENVDFDISLRTGYSLPDIQQDAAPNWRNCRNGTRLRYHRKNKGQYIQVGLRLRDFTLARKIRIDYDIIGRSKTVKRRA